MKVLFVASKNTFRYSVGTITTQVAGPANALSRQNIQIDYFLVTQKGIKGYLKAIIYLTKYIHKHKDIDIIHAHNGLSGLVSSFAFHKKPIIVSFMGSDILGAFKLHGYSIMGKILYLLHNFFSTVRYSLIIVKSVEMKQKIFSKWKCRIIPNGVDLTIFYPVPKKEARQHLNIPFGKKILLFVADPEVHGKNINLTKEIFQKIKNPQKQLLIVFGKTQKELNYFYNAADVLILTSHHEGSPNVIKEALACNLPIVSLDVGDVKEHFSKVNNCFIVNGDLTRTAKVIDYIFDNNLYSDSGRNYIKKYLSDEKIAKKMIKIYSEIIN